MNKILILFFFLLFISCENSENFLSKEESDKIEIQALILKDNKTYIKEISVGVGDSVLLQAKILPDSVLHLKKYFWTFRENERMASFLWKKEFSEPGVFYPKFYLVDYHGDTLYDSVQVHVSETPLLDSLSFIPKDKSQKLPLTNISFAFQTLENYDEKPACFFKIFCADSLILDTLLKTSSLFLTKKLPPLESCSWEVFAENAYGISGNKITASFTTTDTSGLSKIKGKILLTPDSILKNTEIFLESKDTLLKQTPDKSGNFEFPELKENRYFLYAQTENYSDYKGDTLSFYLNSGILKNDILLFLQDKTPPEFYPDIKDTLLFQKEFHFTFINHGIPLTEENVLAYANKKQLKTKLSKDTLILYLEDYEIPEYQLVKINLQDYSGNSTLKSFLLKNPFAFGKTLSDTTLTTKSDFEIYYQEKNTYNLTVGNVKIKNEMADTSFSASDFNNQELRFLWKKENLKTGTNSFELKVIYTNGLERQYSFTVEVFDD